MFWSKGCGGLNSTTLGQERGGREARGVPQKHIKAYKGEGALKLINLERTLFLAPIQKKLVLFTSMRIL